MICWSCWDSSATPAVHECAASFKEELMPVSSGIKLWDLLFSRSFVSFLNTPTLPATQASLPQPVILCHVTDNVFSICKYEATYYCACLQKPCIWNVVQMFFGLNFAILDNCVIIDHSNKAYGLISAVFGPS
jgi:hypothetical protein